MKEIFVRWQLCSFTKNAGKIYESSWLNWGFFDGKYNHIKCDVYWHNCTVCCQELWFWHSIVMMFVHCVSKKVPAFKLSVTFSNLNGFSKLLHYWKAYEICYIQYYPPHLRHVATLPWKIKKSNFSRYLADVDKNANKLHYKFTAFYSSMRVTVYTELCVGRIFKILSIQRHSCFLW